MPARKKVTKPKSVGRPRKVGRPKKGGARTVQNGEGFFDVLKGANKFLKDNKLLSTGATALGSVLSTIPQTTAYAQYANNAANLAKTYGYGQTRGRGITLSI